MSREPFLKRYGLSIALFVLFALSWILQIVAQLTKGEGWVDIVSATMENWQSEFLQLLTFVVLSTFLIHRGSPQSRDGDDEMKSQLEDMQAKQLAIESKLSILMNGGDSMGFRVQKGLEQPPKYRGDPP